MVSPQTGGNAADDYFSDGLTDELIAQLVETGVLSGPPGPRRPGHLGPAATTVITRVRLTFGAVFLMAVVAPGATRLPAQGWHEAGLAAFDTVWRTVNDTYYDPAFGGLVGPAPAERTLGMQIANNYLDGELRPIGSFATTKELAAWMAAAIPFLATWLAGGMLAFALSFDEVIVTTFTAGQQQTLPIWMLQELIRPRQRPVTNVVAVVIIALVNDVEIPNSMAERS